MKKWCILILVVVMVSALALTASASTGAVQRTLSYNDIKITLDGKEIIPKDANGNYVEPFIIDGTTYLPVRGISSALGLGVGWDQNTHTVQLTSQGLAPDPDPTPAPAPTVDTIGGTQAINNITVQLTDVRRNTGGEYFTPEAGKEYLIFEFDIKNNGKDEIAISSLLSFSAYIDGYQAQLNLTAIVEDGGIQMDTSLPAGKSILGIVAYEVPSDWSEAEIDYIPGYWDGPSVAFTVSRSQVK